MVRLRLVEQLGHHHGGRRHLLAPERGHRQARSLDDQCAGDGERQQPDADDHRAPAGQSATVSGTTYLDASASSGVTAVVFDIAGTGGTVSVPGAVKTAYGWLVGWNSATVPNGTYTIQSVGAYAGGENGTSASASFTVSN
jgi:hypothetical protein